MFETTNDQSGSQSEKTDNGDFVNEKAFQFDPERANAYPQFGLSTPNASGSGQTTTNQNPANLPPINPRDDQGKTLPKYRMGIGQRILGTVANFANGFARNGAETIYVGPGALNNRYYQDEELRQQQNLSNSSHRPPRSIRATQPWDNGSDQTNDSSALKTNAQSQTLARERWRGILGPQTHAGNSPTYTAFNRQTGQRAGSNDGTTWHLMNDSDSTVA
ncbi:MAG TPA: hypothetical protein VI685_13035 [Candidatus Angelobacter sp.]